MVKILILNPICNDEEMKRKEGHFFDESHYKMIIKEDCDCYGYIDSNTKEKKLLFKFRKNVIPKKFTDLALNSFLEASKKKHDNRGAAAGLLNKDSMPNYVNELVNKDKNAFRSKFIKSNGELSKTLTSNLSKSNIVGFLDKKDRNLKGKGDLCRQTAFNRDYPKLWESSLPFLKHCDTLFSELVPYNYQLQRKRAMLTPEFIIPETAFSTVTINYSWRTGMHKDAGDFDEGFGNLVVIEDPYNKNTYNGGYLGFPRFQVCVDVRTGDFLAMNVHEWHCNTQFKRKKSKIFGNFSEIDITNGWYFNRMSVVLYLRKNMIQCSTTTTNTNKNNVQKGGNKSLKQKKSKNSKLYLQYLIHSLPKEYIIYMNEKYGLLQ